MIYNILFPFVFIFFIPSILWKLIRRGGAKDGFAERLGIFSEEKTARLEKLRGAFWIHSVSVGETVIALAMVRKWLASCPDMRFVISTTTTTGQQLARDGAPDGVEIIFCPIDFVFIVRKVINMIRPSALIIFETEIWPNMVSETVASGAKVFLVNARISDRSFNNYRRFSFFFSPTLKQFSIVCVQTPQDAERFREICPEIKVSVSGNMKFDQKIPEKVPDAGVDRYFGDSPRTVIMGASTHPGEEKLIAGIFMRIKSRFPGLKLILVPRHAERAGEIVAELKEMKMSFHRRTDKNPPAEPADILLLDTTGEMLPFMTASDIVIMGKSLAGHDEGHNLIEPALLAKPIITGNVLKNFRFVLKCLSDDDAIMTVGSGEELESCIIKLVEDRTFREKLGEKGRESISRHKGATEKTIAMIEGFFQK